MFGWFTKKKQEVLVSAFNEPIALKDMVVAVLSDVGMVRANNEDATIILVPDDEAVLQNRGYLLILADGMGGHNSGEVASRMAVEVFGREYYNSNQNIIKSLKQALEKANTAIYEASLTDATLRGMGTTITGIVIKNIELYLTQVGDSRAYLFNSSMSTQLSKDQTLVQYKIDKGEIKLEEADTHPERNVLTNALGTKPFIDGEIKQLQFDWNDDVSLLLCSDGLYEYVKEKEMAELLKAEANIEQVAMEMVENAKNRGGHDNITVIIASRKASINKRPPRDTEPG
ncbi:MAG: Stp1/IreP family PP2C-type Ser/Thr phosphatase [Sphingobacteriales bacterium]|jgi:serine/threonine protein phosphatase PrpC|nr:Stp1/IreP family PP2C-type Ser/Thr phosphatase [Sphingobacteriales bacterium]